MFLIKIKRFVYITILFIFNKLNILHKSSPFKELRSNSDDGLYLRAVNKFLKQNKKFKNFRKNIYWKLVVENTTKDIGNKYLNEIPEKFLTNELKSLYLDIDSIGSPYKFFFEKVNLFFSGNIARYLNVAYKIDLLLKGKNLKELNIIEIGVGCGAQYLILGS